MWIEDDLPKELNFVFFYKNGRIAEENHNECPFEKLDKKLFKAKINGLKITKREPKISRSNIYGDTYGEIVQTHKNIKLYGFFFRMLRC